MSPWPNSTTSGNGARPGAGLAELTPAASLGKYRITGQGRAWIAAYTAPEDSGD